VSGGAIIQPPTGGTRRQQFDAAKAIGEAEEKAAQLKQREAFFARIPGPFRFGYADRECPQCGSSNAKPKRFCEGRDPWQGPEATCWIVGEHLHASCECGFGWIERVKCDEHEAAGRGAPRFDERYDADERKIRLTVVVSGLTRWDVPVEVPTAAPSVEP